jgi:hypothetical protein
MSQRSRARPWWSRCEYLGHETDSQETVCWWCSGDRRGLVRLPPEWRFVLPRQFSKLVELVRRYIAKDITS